MMGSLRALSVTVPTVKGPITTTDSLFADAYKLNLTSPAGTQALVGIPKSHDWITVTVNGTKIWDRGIFLNNVSGISTAGADSRRISFNVAPGTWEFIASSAR
jgi:hypothetical protein